MKNTDLIKNKIKEIIFNKLSVYDEVVSVTLPGSFEKKDDISIISDIDVIIIVEKLYKEIFYKIINSFKISGSECLLPDYSVKINSTFGPLKFNTEKVIVFHLMVYDIEGHKNHVINSPFTCNDWEKTFPLYGKPLKEVYPSSPLQLSDLLSKRRGMEVYAKDLDNKSLSYIEYQFENNKVTKIKKYFDLNERLKKEYIFHIIKFLILNMLKILDQKNISYSELELIQKFKTHNDKFVNLFEVFKSLYNWKYNYGKEPLLINSIIKTELKGLNEWYTKLVNEMPKVTFIRHAKTFLNDGSFLGIKRDPDILELDSLTNNHFDIIYSGTLKRTISTANLFLFDKHFKSSLINEIDYGDAEGLNIHELKEKYPYIIKKWEQGEDPKFPNGENHKDVLDRLNLFLENQILYSKYKRIAVISHNVVIRVLLSKFYNIDDSLIHLMQPEHLEFISFRVYNGIIIPELNEKQRNKFRNQFMKWN
jgi:ribonuclease H / adenosylcobalamin/alpha-ribazole phosphatase